MDMKKYEARRKNRIEQMKKDGYEYDITMSWFENRLFYVSHLESIGKVEEAEKLALSSHACLDLKLELLQEKSVEDEARDRWMKFEGEKAFQLWFNKRKR